MDLGQGTCMMIMSINAIGRNPTFRDARISRLYLFVEDGVVQQFQCKLPVLLIFEHGQQALVLLFSSENCRIISSRRFATIRYHCSRICFSSSDFIQFFVAVINRLKTERRTPDPGGNRPPLRRHILYMFSRRDLLEKVYERFVSTHDMDAHSGIG